MKMAGEFALHKHDLQAHFMRINSKHINSFMGASSINAQPCLAYKTFPLPHTRVNSCKRYEPQIHFIFRDCNLRHI